MIENAGKRKQRNKVETAVALLLQKNTAHIVCEKVGQHPQGYDSDENRLPPGVALYVPLQVQHVRVPRVVNLNAVDEL